MRTRWLAVLVALACGCGFSDDGHGATGPGVAIEPTVAGKADAVEAARVVRIVEVADGYRLLVDGEPFHIKGAGLERVSLEALRERGGNSFRTWRPGGRGESGESLLDRAHAQQLLVTLGIDVARERHGFDYNDEAAVAGQLARIRSEVLRYKDHPALLMWAVGNELNLGASNPRVWDAVNDIAEMIHEIDPNHPVMTTLAGLDGSVVSELKSRAPALDLIGVQLYGDIEKLPEKLAGSGWTGPYVVTEWGPTGHWETTLTSWGAPLEDDSTRKAEIVRDRYQRFIAADQRQSLGSYVFLWGQKQERTPTWYGMFLASGEATAVVDVMQHLWTGRWPDNQSPAISPIRLDARLAGDNIELQPGEWLEASVGASDVESDPLSYRWQLLEESNATSSGGDHEDIPREITLPTRVAPTGTLRFRTPDEPGLYRLFVTVLDGNGNAAHANIPFRVEPSRDP